MRLAFVARPGEDEPQLGPFTLHELERLEQPCMVLVRPGPRGVEDEVLSLLRAWVEALVVDA